MKPEAKQHAIQVWSFQDLLLELYRYAPGPAESLPRHSHEAYQLCLSLDFPGEYFYRGAYYAVPVGSLSVIHPDEVHAARDLEDRQTGATFRMMYVNPQCLRSAAAAVAGRETSLPFFANPIILDSQLIQLFGQLHVALEGAASRLQQESLLLVMWTQLIVRCSEIRPSLRPLGRERLCVQRVRDYLEANLAHNVSLSQLAQVVNLSPYHLHRLFHQAVGLTPHQYQTQRRIDRAKRLLAQGCSLQQVVLATGFADRSHLSRHFKRWVQVTPGQYRLQNRKNVQSSGDQAL